MNSARLLTAALLVLCSTFPAYSTRCPTKRLAKGKIQGGTDAAPGRYPYATSLQRHSHSGKADPKNHFCGGVLIAEDLVVTAAHCVHPEVPGSETFPTLNIGGRDLVDDVDTEIRQTCRTIVHNGFDVDNIANGFDIALIQLDTKSTKIPAKLDTEWGDTSAGKAKALGWGKDVNKPFFMELQEVELDIVQNDECRTKGFNDLIYSMMCAQGQNADVCKGDSGGGLVKVNEGCGEQDILVGLTSFGFECTDTVRGQGKSPGVYTRIYEYCNWIYKLGDKESRIFENPDCDFAPYPDETPANADQDPHAPSTEVGNDNSSEDVQNDSSGESPESGDSTQNGGDTQTSAENHENVEDENRENVETENQVDHTSSETESNTDATQTDGGDPAEGDTSTFEAAGRRLFSL